MSTRLGTRTESARPTLGYHKHLSLGMHCHQLSSSPRPWRGTGWDAWMERSSGRFLGFAWPGEMWYHETWPGVVNFADEEK